MCYPKPGPRCSAHAKEKLERARHAWHRSVATQDFETFETTRLAYKEAEAEYQATPAGLEELRTQADKETSLYERNQILATYEKAHAARTAAIQAYKEVTGKDATADNNGEAQPAEPGPELEAAQLAEHRKQLAQQATWNRHQADRDWEELRNRDSIGKLEDAALIFGSQVRAIFKPDAPLSRYSKERLLISQDRERLNKEYEKLARLELVSRGQSTAQITRVRKALDKKNQMLRYHLDLLSTDPTPDEHPQITRDREQAVRQWQMVKSIDSILA